MSKTVVLSHAGRNKKVNIPEEGNHFQYLRNNAIKLFDFKFDSNVKLEVVFQRYDNELSEFIDIEKDEEINDTLQHKDKLKIVVTPTLVQQDLTVVEVLILGVN